MELTEQVKRSGRGWFEARESDYNLHSRFFKVAARFGGIAPKFPGFNGPTTLRALRPTLTGDAASSKSCERNTGFKRTVQFVQPS